MPNTTMYTCKYILPRNPRAAYHVTVLYVLRKFKWLLYLGTYREGSKDSKDEFIRMRWTSENDSIEEAETRESKSVSSLLKNPIS